MKNQRGQGDKEKMETVRKQERELVFEHFDSIIARRLGNLMADTADKKEMPVVISIRLNSGLTLYQYAAEGAALLNQIWADKKYHTVRVFDKNSLLCLYESRLTGQSMEDHGLADICAYAPGGFPIRVKDIGTVGAITVSGLPEEEDHTFIVEILEEFLTQLTVWGEH